MVRISLIICTHNPRMDYLNRVLTALREQTLEQSLWELVVVDNGSTEPLSNRFDVAWHACGRIVRENRLGLAFARMRGIAESQGDVLVFIDDDNVLDLDYLVQCLRIGDEWPQLGVWGGSVVPEFEIPPPRHLRPYLKCLALREVKKPRWSNVWSCVDAEPVGAGLCVRKRAALAYCEQYGVSRVCIGDRTGESLLSGGDTEIVYAACNLGMGMGVFPELNLLHLIPKQRIDEGYLVKIAQGISTSSMLLKFKWFGIFPESPFSPQVVARLLEHCLLRRGIERRMSLASFRARVAARKIIRESYKEIQPEPDAESVSMRIESGK